MSSFLDMAEVFENLAVADEATIAMFERISCSPQQLALTEALREEIAAFRRQAARLREGSFN